MTPRGRAAFCSMVPSAGNPGSRPLPPCSCAWRSWAVSSPIARCSGSWPPTVGHPPATPRSRNGSPPWGKPATRRKKKIAGSWKRTEPCRNHAAAKWPLPFSSKRMGSSSPSSEPNNGRRRSSWPTPTRGKNRSARVASRLVGKEAFAGLHQAADFWSGFRLKLDSHYDLARVQQYVLGTDGAHWTKQGMETFSPRHLPAGPPPPLPSHRPRHTPSQLEASLPASHGREPGGGPGDFDRSAGQDPRKTERGPP